MDVDRAPDYDRLLRFFRGEAVGVVLSGGGARGWFHVGALRALQEARVPIDAIGGASSGALAGACYATDPSSYERYYQKVFDICMTLSSHMALHNLILPVVSIFNAKRTTESLVRAFGDLDMEDLHTPFFCVSCNLNQAREAVWQRGKLWEAVRSCVAIPVLISPMVSEGDLHFDGGLVNNLPVDVMRRILPPPGIVIAVDVTDTAIDENRYHFPSTFGFVDSLLTFFKRARSRHYSVPSFTETILKALMVGGTDRVTKNRTQADFLIRTDLSATGMTDIRRGIGLAETGYPETRRLLETLPRDALRRMSGSST